MSVVCIQRKCAAGCFLISFSRVIFLSCDLYLTLLFVSALLLKLINRAFPDLHRFLSEEVQLYKDVRIDRVLNPIVTLHILEDEKEVKSVEIHRFRRARLHSVMQAYFELKSEADLRSDDDKRELKRRQRSLKFFRKEEYVRKREMYCNLFRRDIMQKDENNSGVTWVVVTGDWMHRNYDKINFRHAVMREELVEYAEWYLEKQQSI